MIQEVTLRSLVDAPGYPPPDPIGYLVRRVPHAVQMAVRMAFRGRSGPGRPPAWLRAMTDIRFVEARGGAETVVRFEAPRLGEAAGDEYAQLELWQDQPDAEDTGFDLLGDIIADLEAHDRDSTRFDPPILKAVRGFGQVVNGHFDEMLVTGRRYPAEKPAVMDKAVIETAGEFYKITPSPVRARMVGTLDRIEASTRSFTVLLDDGARAHGLLAEGEIDDLAVLFDRRVLVLGEAVFRPSGRFLRVDAEHVSLAGDEPPIWSELPEPGDARLDVHALRVSQGRKRGLAAVVGQWPGDETDEEIAELLKELS